jgi:hypothetical protein
MTMTDPPDDHRDSVGGTPLEHDRHIINGSMLAVAAFAIVAIGIAWYALTDGQLRSASTKPPMIERSVPDSTTGYGGTRPKTPAPSPTAK